MKLALVGDIGGTNARFALWENDQLRSVSVLATADYACPEDAIKVYLHSLDISLGAVGSVCLSVAGPVSGDEFRFTNNHWRLSRTAFCKTLQVDNVLLINDFSAMALGMTRLEPADVLQVCPGIADPTRPAVVIGRSTWPPSPGRAIHWSSPRLSKVPTPSPVPGPMTTAGRVGSAMPGHT